MVLCMPWLCPAAVYALWPPAGPAGSRATIIGYSTWMLDQDCAATQLTEGSPPSCIGSIMVGGYLCMPDVNSYTKLGVSRFSGAWLYRLTCSLPDPKQVRAARWGLMRGAAAWSPGVCRPPPFS